MRNVHSVLRLIGCERAWSLRPKSAAPVSGPLPTSSLACLRQLAVPEPLRRWMLPYQHLYIGPLLLFAKASWNLWSMVTALIVRRWADAAGMALHYALFIGAGCVQPGVAGGVLLDPQWRVAADQQGTPAAGFFVVASLIFAQPCAVLAQRLPILIPRSSREVAARCCNPCRPAVRSCPVVPHPPSLQLLAGGTGLGGGGALVWHWPCRRRVPARLRLCAVAHRHIGAARQRGALDGPGWARPGQAFVRSVRV